MLSGAMALTKSDIRLQTNMFGYCNHYENMPIQTYRKFHLQKHENFQVKNSDIFHISAQNIDCGYLLEPPP